MKSIRSPGEGTGSPPALHCPRCREPLRLDGISEPAWRCAACDRTYPVICGIPDLRVAPDPYIGIDADRAKGRAIAERAADLDFAGLVAWYYAHTDVVPAHHARAYTRGLLAAEARAAASLAAWDAHLVSGGGAALGGDLLEVGCGTGPLLVATAPRVRSLVGVDVAFRWLVVAHKRLAEGGVDTMLVCANAEALPFAGAAFDAVAMESVLEVVQDQAGALAEAARVARPGAPLVIATPNRFSLGPDPHVGTWGAGLLPERVVAAIARRQGAIPPRRRLHTSRSLARVLRRAGFARPRVFLPDVPAAHRRRLPPMLRAAAAVYTALAFVPLTRWLLLVVGPLLLAVAERERAAP